MNSQNNVEMGDYSTNNNGQWILEYFKTIIRCLVCLYKKQLQAIVLMLKNNPLNYIFFLN